MRLSSWLRCRRGSVALVFSVSAIPAFGLVALGTEAGMWLATQRHAQNAADSAAYSGALRLANPDGQTVAYRGKEFAAQNGFCNAGDTNYAGTRCGALPAGTVQTVTINNPPVSGAYAGNAKAVQAITSQTQPPLISSLYRTGNVTITTSAVAIVKTLSNPCALALKGSISFHDNGIVVNAPNCALVSDAATSGAITFNNNQKNVTVGSISTSGGCTGDAAMCSTVLTYEPLVPDPLAGLNAAINGLTLPNCTGAALVAYTAATKCANNNFSTNKVTTLTTGTYFFSGTVKLTGTGSIATAAGASATLILLPGATLSMKGTSTLNITAQTTVPTTGLPPALQSVANLLAGVALYDTESGAVTINGDTTNTAYGVMYLPNADVTFGGNTAVTTSCIEVIAGSIMFSGSTNFANSGCPATVKPVAQIVQLVQ